MATDLGHHDVPDDAAVRDGSADHLRLLPLPGCRDATHVVCWRVECRRCGACAGTHVSVLDVRVVAHDFLDDHVCGR